MTPEYATKDSIFDIVFGEFCACSDETEQVLNNIIEQVRALPAADIVPVRHGQWIFYHYELYGCYYECSNCKYESNKKTNFCPNCGSRMDGESNV